jgi:hypothetical protein
MIPTNEMGVLLRKQLVIEWWIFVGAIAAGLVYLAAPWWVVLGWLLAQVPVSVVWQIMWWQRRAAADVPGQPMIVTYRPAADVIDAPSVRLLP